MLNGEQEQNGRTGQLEEGPLTYAAYLKVPQLLELQALLSHPQAHDEMLFIIAQQVQELWFKQILHELHPVVALFEADELPEAVRFMSRVNRIMALLVTETAILETMPPQDFHEFRHVLVTSSGFESEQFRELELASGLKDPTFLKVMENHLNIASFRERWPRNLHDAFCELFANLRPDVVDALIEVYGNRRKYPELFAVAEALSEYEVLFSEWRFSHVKLVERTLGDRSPGTAGSSGAGYLGKTLGYRFFPELWETRNRLTAAASRSSL